MLLNRRSFTLVETLLVVVLVGALATVGFVSYMDTIEKSRAAEAYPTLAAMRDGYLSRLAENLCVSATTVPGCTWNPNIIAASNQSWDDIGMENPNANPNAYFAYDYWDANYASGTAPVSDDMNVGIAFRREKQESYWIPTQKTKYIYMDLDMGKIYKSKPY